MPESSIRPEGGRVADSPLTQVAVLDRTIEASLERIWENVLDWEHLPWLHRTSFSDVRILDAGEWGWRARVGMSGEKVAQTVVELVVERAERRYVSRTVEGRGAGTEIWTALEPRAELQTDIRVEFWLPHVREERAVSLGRSFQMLYTRLWDEDEAMMRARECALAAERTGATPTKLALGQLDTLLPTLPRLVELAGQRYRLVAIEDELLVHSTVCPHRLGPLEGADQEGVPAASVRCPWHGYVYDIRTGRCSSRRGLRLRPAPRIDVAEDGSVTLCAGS